MSGDATKITQSPFELAGPHGDWRDDILERGYVVVKNAIPKERAAFYRSKAHEWLKSFDSNLDVDNPSTWDASKLPVQTDRNTFEHYSVVHEKFMWEARMEPGVIDAFAKVWGTNELLVSFDAVNVTFPGLKPVRSPWPHIDQAPRKRGLHCVQGIINLSHAGPEDGSLVVVPGSHKLVEKFFDDQTDPSTWEWRDNRYFSEKDMEWFKKYDLAPKKVLAGPGDLILWDSRTIHWGGEPTADSNIVRTVIYAAYAPATLATEASIKEKQKVFHLHGATTHWPHDNIKLRELQAALPDGNLDPRHRVKPSEIAEQNDQLLRLAGVMAY